MLTRVLLALNIEPRERTNMTELEKQIAAIALAVVERVLGEDLSPSEKKAMERTLESVRLHMRFDGLNIKGI